MGTYGIEQKGRTNMKQEKKARKEKIKQWKKAIREYDSITERDVVTPVEEDSQRVLQTLEQGQPSLESLYEDLAQAQDPEQLDTAVMQRLRSYRRASTMSFPPGGTM